MTSEPTYRGSVRVDLVCFFRQLRHEVSILILALVFMKVTEHCMFLDGSLSLKETWVLTSSIFGIVFIWASCTLFCVMWITVKLRLINVMKINIAILINTVAWCRSKVSSVIHKSDDHADQAWKLAATSFSSDGDVIYSRHLAVTLDLGLLPRYFSQMVQVLWIITETITRI